MWRSPKSGRVRTFPAHLIRSNDRASRPVWGSSFWITRRVFLARPVGWRGRGDTLRNNQPPRVRPSELGLSWRSVVIPWDLAP